MNLFEEATRRSFLFDTTRGLLNVQDVWKMRLIGGDFCLNGLAISLDQQLGDKSFVKTKTTAAQDENQIKLDIVKYIIAYKQELEQARILAVGKRAKKDRIRAIIAAKDDEALVGKSRDELLKELEDL